jgi:hypothetical protein
MIVQAVRLYGSTVPTTFRIGAVTIDPDRATFSIGETRISCSWINNETWADPDYREQGLSVCRFTLSLRDGRLCERWTPLAHISLHALARRYERGGADRAAILVDLADLTVPDDPSAGQIATADGTWLGDSVQTGVAGGGTARAINVRTWVQQT